MSLRVLVVPDKFKGTLTASDAAAAIRQGWLQSRPTDQVQTLPMSDGGDGFGPVLGQLLNARARRLSTVNAAGNPVTAHWWWDQDHAVAVVETARVIGLAMLPPGQHHPFELDTRGLASLFRAIARAGAKSCLIGIGGSATNDGGFGLATALGWKFLDAAGSPVRRWTDGAQIRSAEPPPRPPLPFKATVAVDVQNPLLGPKGASRIYGPQKGLLPQDMQPAEAALRGIARAVERRTGERFAATPGAGAAGGLGFGLMTFLGAKPVSGFALFGQLARLEARIRASDVVVTAEGSLDKSSLMGKGVGEVARLAQHLGKPCIGLGGVTADPKHLARHFAWVGAMAPTLTDSAAARATPGPWLARLASLAATDLQPTTTRRSPRTRR